jgi:hypothetical protein
VSGVAGQRVTKVAIDPAEDINAIPAGMAKTAFLGCRRAVPMFFIAGWAEAT